MQLASYDDVSFARNRGSTFLFGRCLDMFSRCSVSRRNQRRVVQLVLWIPQQEPRPNVRWRNEIRSRATTHPNPCLALWNHGTHGARGWPCVDATTATCLSCPRTRTKPPTDLECAICLEPMSKDNALTPCHHLYHRDCLAKWMNFKKECPMCRKELIPLS